MRPETVEHEWKPRYLVTKAPGVDGPPIPQDEPVLVIRAQDSLAGSMLAQYIVWYQQLDNADERLVDDLIAHQDALIDWQDHNRSKMKTADR